MSIMIYDATVLHAVDCCKCGIRFGINETLNRLARIEKQKSIYCPSCGERQGWSGERPEEKVRREMMAELHRVKREKEYMEARERDQRARAEMAELSLRATKGIVTRIKNRVAKGVCPCCNRSFANLHNHMKTQHPDFVTT